MANIIPFAENSKVPAYLKAAAPLGNQAEFSSGGFPVLSIKSKVFSIRRGDVTERVSMPDDPETPAPYVEAVILNMNPGVAKVYYEKNWSEGAVDKPTCYSNDGVTPAADADEPQSSKCATCAHNVFGSKINESGNKTFACSNSKRIAVAAVNAISDPMLLRIPATSIKAFNEFHKFIQARGVQAYQAVVARIGFDYNVSHPALTFKPVGLVDDATFAEIVEMVDSEVVHQIIGTSVVPPRAGSAPHEEDEGFETKRISPPKSTAPAADDDEPKPRVKVKVEAADPEPAAEAPKPAPKKAKPAEPVVVDDLEEGIDAALGGLDWDD